MGEGNRVHQIADYENINHFPKPNSHLLPAEIHEDENQYTEPVPHET